MVSCLFTVLKTLLVCLSTMLKNRLSYLGCLCLQILLPEPRVRERVSAANGNLKDLQQLYNQNKLLSHIPPS